MNSASNRASNAKTSLSMQNDIIMLKGLGSLTNNFCPANFEKIILQRASKCFNDYKI